MASGGAELTGLSLFRLKAKIGEASSLTPVTDPGLLARLDADAACWTVHDEEFIRSSVSLLIARGSHFEVVPVIIDLARRQRGTDAESVYVRDGTVTVLGSGFVGGKKTIDPRRSFVATFSESAVRLTRSKRGVHAAVAGNATVMGMDLTAAVNSALQSSGISIAQPSKAARRAAKKAGLPGGVPINIEGAVAGPDGTTLIGLRSPVAATGRPLILRVPGDVAQGLSGVAASEVVEVDVDANAKRPAGVRDLAFADGRIHLITAGAESTMLANRVERAPCQHLSVDIDGGDRRTHRTFDSKARIEGLARPQSKTNSQTDGWWYVIDDEKAVVVLSDT